MSMIPMAGVVSGRGSQPGCPREVSMEQTPSGEAAVPWGTHIHLGQEERQSWMAEGASLSPAWSRQRAGLAGPGEAGAAAG